MVVRLLEREVLVEDQDMQEIMSQKRVTFYCLFVSNI